MSSITKVALAGLLEAGFKVAVLTRDKSKHSFPPTVTTKSIDENSLDSLVSALEGQDALISTLSHVAVSTQPVLNVTIPTQLLLIEAAAKAHVKRSIPSEFGSDTLNEKAGGLPILKPKVQVHDALKKEAASSGMTYTLICSGVFLDWGIMVGFIMNLKEKSIDLYDGGDDEPPIG